MIMPKIWRTSQEVEVENVGDNIFVLYFRNVVDRKRVLEGGPWSFDNALSVLEVPSGFGDFSDMEFRWTPFWIQFHNIPLLCMTKQIGMQLGQHIGTVKGIVLASFFKYVFALTFKSPYVEHYV
ncbi:hypothetical protein ACOSP7_028495 [Xanthoceras sorbifolium]